MVSGKWSLNVTISSQLNKRKDVMICTVCGLKELSGSQRRYCGRLCERKAWRDGHRDQILEGKKRYRTVNRQRIALYERAYRAKHPEINPRLATQLKSAYACLRCSSRERPEVHHIKSQRLGGGPNDLNNVVVLCKPCHALWHKMFNRDYWKLVGSAEAPPQPGQD